jgi:hypothetical protein
VTMITGSQAQIFDQYLKTKATNYYKEFDFVDLKVNLESEEARPASIFYRFSLDDGKHKKFVLVKIPLSRETNGKDANRPNDHPDGRPRLVPITSPEVKFKLEYTALSAIYEYFKDINDSRFGAVPVLDFLPDQQAILMEEIQLPSLRQLLINSSFLRFRSNKVRLNQVFYNAGAWLRIYHQLPKSESVHIRHARRNDFIATIGEFTDFLASRLGDKEFFQRVFSKIDTISNKELPELLPLGLGHGDYATRNILVDPNGRVTVLDTLARWRVPIYEDIAYFLVGMKTSWQQILTFGFGHRKIDMDLYQQAFLSGYFDNDPIPYGAIRLFEFQALLDRWSALLVILQEQSTGLKSILARTRIFMMNHYFKHLAKIQLAINLSKESNVD